VGGGGVMSWSPDPTAFLRDLEAKPERLRALADALDDDPWRPVERGRRIVCLGMGSSRFAAIPIVARLRSSGMDAAATYATTAVTDPGGPGTLAIAISASGSTPETVEALERHRAAGSRTVAITNDASSPLAQVARWHIPLLAGEETGGVACRTFQHTLAILLTLLDAPRAASSVRRAADATEDLLARRSDWLAPATDLLTATNAAFLVAPDDRSSSAAQGALMLREGPRISADACDTGDWLHVDVYLTKPLDYRALLFAGTRFDAEVARWIGERGGSFLAVGGDVAGATLSIRYPGDDDGDVALLTETLVAELIAAERWREA
jgi:fructoselysine-6-P-deglycase FrlB-like protein